MYNIKKLPFAYQDLEPFLSTKTIATHYKKHQVNYLNNFNNLLIKNNYNFSMPLLDLYNNLSYFNIEDQSDILFNLGGVVNHELYWQSINPYQKELPKDLLLEAINNKYESLSNFQNKFNEIAKSLKGSGYVFLVKNEDKELDIVKMANQDNPLLNGQTPLFCLDMWEHAYYLNYQNNKDEYLANFWQIANFKEANDLFNEVNR